MAFQPMGVQAYELAEPLDLDGIYHLAVLELLIDPEAALRTVERILAVEPDHILGLAVVAEAAVKKGDRTTAAETYQTILDVFDAESGRGLVEYQDHRTMLVQVKADAEAFVAGR
jgi:predicted TPR repeat methyltransferase